MAISNFSPTGYAWGSAIAGAQNRIAIPATAGATLLVTNLGPSAAVVLLGSSSVAATVATGVAVLPNHSLALAIGAATHVSIIGAAGLAQVNIARGD